MAIAVAARQTNNGSATSGPATLAAHAIGDLLVAIVSVDGTRTIAGTAGWTITTATAGSSTNAVSIGLAMKVATSAAESLTFTWGAVTESYAVHSWTITGHGVTNPATDVGVNGTAGSATSFSVVAASNPVPAAGCLGILSIANAYGGPASYYPTTAGASWTDLRTANNGTTTAGTAIHSQERIYTPPTSTVTPAAPTGRSSASQYINLTIAIPEAYTPPAHTSLTAVGSTLLAAGKLAIGAAPVDAVYVGSTLVYGA